MNPPTIAIGGRMSRGQYQFTLQSPDIQTLYKYGEMMEQQMRELPGLQDVSSDLRMKNPQINVVIQRDKASAAGITAAQIEIGPVQRLRLPPGFHHLGPQQPVPCHPGAAGRRPARSQRPHMLYIRSDRGELVPLSAIAELIHRRRPPDHQPPGSASLRDDLLQPVPGRFPRRGDGPVNQLATRDPCRPPSAPAIRAPPRPSSPR